MKPINFIIQTAAVKHPNNRAVVKLSFKKCIHKNVFSEAPCNLLFLKKR